MMSIFEWVVIVILSFFVFCLYLYKKMLERRVRKLCGEISPVADELLKKLKDKSKTESFQGTKEISLKRY